MAKHTDRIDLRVPPGEKEAWMIEAERRGDELSPLIRKAVPFYLKAHPPKRKRRKTTA
jgi:hypothetical protein